MMDQDANSNSEGRKCACCGIWKRWDGFHRKGKRFSSRCKYCINLEKRHSREKTRKGKPLLKQIKLRCHIVGKLTGPVIE